MMRVRKLVTVWLGKADFLRIDESRRCRAVYQMVRISVSRILLKTNDYSAGSGRELMSGLIQSERH